MTYQEYIEQKGQIEGQIKDLQNALYELSANRLAQSPLKIGDKVVVSFERNKDQVAFISHVRINTHKRFSDEFEYSFNKVKKDGTMSQQSAGIYVYESVRLA